MLNLSSILNKNRKGVIDDFRIVRVWKEYTDDRKYMKYLMYELEMMEENGHIVHFYKAVKFTRIIRLPKSAKQSEAFMEMHAQILAAIWERNIKLLTVIANLLQPVALGLLYLYGVQGVADTPEQAKKTVDRDFIALCSALQGTYRVLEHRVLTYEELEWLHEKMYKMDCMTVVRGIPKAKSGGVDAGDKGMGGKNVNVDSQDTTEEYIAGMSDKEYVLQIISSPVKSEHLERWLSQTAREMTRWNKQLQGSTSMNFSLSIPMMYMANLGASQGWNHSYTEADTVTDTTGSNISSSVSDSVGHSVGDSLGKSIGKSLGVAVGENSSTSHGTANGSNSMESFGENSSHSDGVSDGVSAGHSYGGSESSSHNVSESSTVGNSYTKGTSRSESESVANSVSHSQSQSSSVAKSQTESFNTTETNGTSGNRSMSQGESHTTGTNSSTSVSDSKGQTSSVNQSQSAGTSQNTSHTTGSNSSRGTSGSSGWSSGTTLGKTTGLSGGIFVINGSSADSYSESSGTSGSEGWNSSTGSSISDSTSSGTSITETVGTSNGNSHTVTNGSSSGVSESFGMSKSVTESEGWNQSVANSHGQSMGVTESQSNTVGSSVGQTISQGVTNGTSESMGVSSSQGVSEGWGESRGSNWGINSSENHSSSSTDSSGTSHMTANGVNSSENWGDSHGVSSSESQTDSFSESSAHTTGQTWGHTNGSSVGSSIAKSIGKSAGQSMGSSGTVSSGAATSMGIGPSVGYSKSYQWLDAEVQNILTLLQYQNDRLMKALRGNGAFFTDVYLATNSEENLAAAGALAKSAWTNDESKICPLQIMDLSAEEQNHLLYHYYAFSPDNRKEGIPGRMESYRYSTILLSDEFSAYTHLPRISEGGIFADVGDIPKFSVPSGKMGDIYIGKVLSGERWTTSSGYETPFEYRIDDDELMHGIFTGESRSGKTVAATRFISELTKVRRKKTGKRLRIVALDPKQDWRILAKFVEPERFHFFSLGNPEFLPISLNLCKVPKNVNPQVWADSIIEIFCRAYGLMERGKAILAESLYALYEEAGVFEDSPDWRRFVPERSAQVTFPKLYERMNRIKLDLEDPMKSGKGRMGNEARDAYTRVLDRLQIFGRKFSIETRLFGQPDGIAVDELIGKDDVIVLESYGLETTFKNFVFGCITSGFFKYAQAHEKGFMAEDQYETVLVIEEANEVLTGSDTAGTGNAAMPSFGGQSEFEKILDQSAGLGLFIFSITQKVADMPSSVIANSGLIFAGKISRPDDVMTVIRKIGREERYDDRDVLKWFPRSPIGWFVCRSSRNFDFKESEPVLVKVEPLNVESPNNYELETRMLQRSAIQLL